MKTQNVFIAIVGTLALLMVASTGLIAQTGDYGLDISPIQDYWYEGQVIDHHVTEPPEQIYVHLTAPEPMHIVSYMSEHFDPPTGGSWSNIEIGPSFTMTPSVWYPLGMVTVSGKPSDLISFSIDFTFDDGVELWSNTLTKHITPEPSSLLALGTGALGMGGLLLRRRRS